MIVLYIAFSQLTLWTALTVVFVLRQPWTLDIALSVEQSLKLQKTRN